MRRATGWKPDWFTIETWKVETREGRAPWSSANPADRDAIEVFTEATIKVHIGDRRSIATAEGNGPVNALDAALRLALNGAEISGSWGMDVCVAPERQRQGIGSELVRRGMAETPPLDHSYFTTVATLA